MRNLSVRKETSELDLGVIVIVPTLPTPLNPRLDNVDSKIYEVWSQFHDDKYGKVEVLNTLPSISK